jgi:two-component system LytT family sensor kinase
VDVYLKIEQARFGEKLRVVREIAPEALEASIPSLILQPLVENAIKHGRASDGEIDLTIRAELQGDAVVVSVADQGPGMPPHFEVGAGAGHGLRNVDERLRKRYGDKWGVEILANEPRGAAVTVRIPLGEDQ